MGVVASRHVESSLLRDETHVLCISRQIINYWTTKGSPKVIPLISIRYLDQTIKMEGKKKKLTLHKEKTKSYLRPSNPLSLSSFSGHGFMLINPLEKEQATHSSMLGLPW